MTLRTEEKKLYEETWAIPDYGNMSPGELHADLFVEMAKTLPVSLTVADTILDAGCGSGKGALALQKLGYHVILCDLTPDGIIPELRIPEAHFVEACLWDDLRRQVGEVDWAFCCDVLEHIPPMFTMLVIERLLQVSKWGVFLSISVQPDQFGAWVGQPLHLTVQPFVAWRDALREIAEVVECRDFIHSGIFLIRRKSL